jgi:hypothetical protein
MLFKPNFKGSTSLTYVIFPTGTRNLVNSRTKHRVKFNFSCSKKLFEGFVGFEQGFDILLSQEFRDMIGGSLDMITI